MRRIDFILRMAVGWFLLAGVARGQEALLPESEPQSFQAQGATFVIVDTNAPPTKLEAFEAQTGTVIIKGINPIGSVFAQNGTVTVRSKESKDAGTGRRLYGLAIGLKEGNQPEDITLIDYDELDSLLDGIDYIFKVNRTVSAMPGFSVVYATKAGFRNHRLQQQQPSRHHPSGLAEQSCGSIPDSAGAGSTSQAPGPDPAGQNQPRSAAGEVGPTGSLTQTAPEAIVGLAARRVASRCS